MSTTEQTKKEECAGHELASCEHWGKGGSYVRDPATGVRTKVEDPAQESILAGAQAVEGDKSSAKTTDKKGK